MEPGLDMPSSKPTANAPSPGSAAAGGSPSLKALAEATSLVAVCVLSLIAGDTEKWQRERMVADQIERRGVHNPDLLRVMRAVPRHLFVPAGLRSQAYEDHPLPIGYGATISQPHIVALMTDQLVLEKRHRVLEIGTGSGYQAAILSQLAGEVYTVEIVPELAAGAARTLRDLGYANVTVRQGDGYQGWPERAPFDRIILTAAPPEIPQVLISQLAAGGLLVAPVGSTWNQELIVLEKTARGAISRRSVGAVTFVPMVPAGRH
jgi:protein-L-isoaspartate(D-aspartate) O-methyltransferase